MRDVTGVAATNLFTAKANGVQVRHGFRVGHRVIFRGLTGGTGITPGAAYYVIASGLTDYAFRVSETAGGGALDFSSDLTAGTVRRRIPGSLNSRRNL